MAVGLGVVARHVSPKTKIIAVNVDSSPSMALSRMEGRVVQPEAKPTMADSVAGTVSEDTLRLGKKFIDEVVLVKEASLKSSIAELLRRHRMVVEGSAALGLAAITEGLLPKGLKRVCVVLTGANIDVVRMKDIVNHHLQA